MDAVAGEVVVAAARIYTGQCLCGAVSFRAENLSDIWYCHCRQCQHLTGLYIAAAGVKRDKLSIEGEVNWRPISKLSKSGHCASCASYMFWDEAARDTVSVLAGSLGDTEGLAVKGHIFVKDKAPYYEITDGLPQFEGFPPQGTRGET